ncbi:helix-turn-helix domain-containing protein [Pectobacterium polonicum]|uniref:Helix-turn-helix domain-containing protein n=1 Tax=Pectobacterium polonicum TaxID=2485124 RepID=A0AAE9T0A0_9GAMM|nr:helix-turn-helix domain-containing protein [Pectobacterium polonicum]TKY83151.1 helix-turn-helix domain-containing protein [Pectobacterium polonicum]UVO07207.1 helix-turn-helix domain-containing protein [Pectobacterium polonicum]GKW23920.1 transcriptional regulator [Pectobacterium carotovorum subsp. carotovorum]
MKNLSSSERDALLAHLLTEFFNERLSIGGLLHKLRKDVFGMSQEQYATLVEVSRRTLSDIEKDRGSQSIMLLNRVFRPLGLKVGLLPRSTHLMYDLLEKGNHSKN